jgi:hypothetical protein
MKITTRNITNRGCPSLWQIVVNGKDFVGGRVLKMGRVYLPVYDGGGVADMGQYTTRKLAAEHVVRHATGSTPTGR